MTAKTRTASRASARPAPNLARTFKRSRVPLYIQVATLLRRRIEDGQFAAGQKMPTLDELEREFQVARVTVRQAIDLLQKEGLVWRQQGKGTFVSQDMREKRWLRLAIDMDSLAQTIDGNVPKFVSVKDPPPLPRLLPEDGKAADDYHYLRSIQYRGGEPFAIASVHVAQAIYDRFPEEFETHTTLPVLVRHQRDDIGRAQTTVVIGSADPETAELLRIPLNAPIAEARFIIENREGVVIYVAELVYRGDCVRFDIDLLKDGGGAGMTLG
ncbi:GntR family transcriptional regulator [Azospirillum sp.]|uniref:GntR family transcriptional regulator n=1 Tax=Azospirillum sp. TaxID=34012 RepID=UPI003D70A00F